VLAVLAALAALAALAGCWRDCGIGGIGLSAAEEQPEWATSNRRSNHGGIRKAHVRLPTACIAGRRAPGLAGAQ